MDSKTNLSRRTSMIPRMQAVGEGGWQRNESLSLASRFAWLIAGFNIGVGLLFVVVWLILPLIWSGFSVERTDSSPEPQAFAPQRTPTATVTLTSIPSNTPVPPTEDPQILTATAESAATLAVELDITPTVTLTPSITPIPPTATPIPPTPTPLPPPASYSLNGIDFHQQGWNNCGPANLAMGLSFYGWNGTQDDTASVLKPNREDRNVSPQQMVDYVTQYTNLNAIWRMAGDLDMIRWLVSNNFLVIVESGFEPAGEGWFGHYETVVGYDDTRGTITVYDSYLGRENRPSVTRSYQEFDNDWQSFNRNYIVMYPASREIELRNFLGVDWATFENTRKAAEIAQREAAEAPSNGFAWFNLGTSLTALGRYEEAVAAFGRAFELNLPYRMMWYQFSPYEALLQVGRFDEVIDLANSTLQTTEYVEETYYYKGRAYEYQGNYVAAYDEYSAAVEFNPNYTQAHAALRRVESYQ